MTLPTASEFIGTSPRRSRKTIQLHLCCWILLIAYEMGALYYTGRKMQPLYIYGLYYGINISFFYLLTSVADRLLEKNKPFLLIALALLLAFLGFLVIKSLLDYLLAVATPRMTKMQQVCFFIPSNVVRGVYFVILAAFYQVAGYMARYRQQAAEARIAFLQQQLQPHMLFNALNFVYNKVDEQSSEASRCVWLLAELMRFSLNVTTGKVAIADEAQQLQHLIEINRYRFGRECYLQTAVTNDVTGQIIPLVLITLTENLFKHGDLQDELHPAFLQLHTRDGHLQYRTYNRKRITGLSQSPGIGLANIRVRLDHAYGGHYQLAIHETKKSFELELTLPL